jgi:L-asparaginase
MAEIFISYSKLDNRQLRVEHLVTEAISRFIEQYQYARSLSDEATLAKFFRYEASMEAGQSLPERIRQEIDECPVLLAFYSPAYFESEPCFLEWQSFQESRQRAGKAQDGSDQKILIPIEVKPVTWGEFSPLPHPDARKWFEEVAEQTWRPITSDLLIRTEKSEELQAAINKLAPVIDKYIDRAKGTSAEQRSAPNILRVQTPIEGATLKRAEIQEEIRNAGNLRYAAKEPVCVIYAGGTVGMVRKHDSDPVHADYEMAPGIDRIVEPLAGNLSKLPFDMHFFRLAKTIDSSNVTASEWVDLAALVQEQMPYYQGFVLLHGTNTLAYSASALSFLLSESISKPVILTGSEVPLSNLNTDAIHNVENAIRAAAHNAYGGPILIPEVCVYWNNQLYRGNRVTKKYASDRSLSFHTPNMPVPLATLANDKLDVEYAHVRDVPEGAKTPGSAAARIHPLDDVEVGILFIHPDMHFEQLSEQFDRNPDKSPDGLILLSYGPGNVPDDKKFITMLERLIERGTIVANVTQCPYGRVELKLFETSATLFDRGVVDGYDMTLEAAYTKLLWALSAYGPEARKQRRARERIKANFQNNRAGEMGASIFTLHWPAEEFRQLPDSPYRISDVAKSQAGFSRLDIAEAFIRIEGLRFPKDVRKAKVRVFYGEPPQTDDEAAWDNLLADFNKTLTDDEMANGTDKNLEVTHTFRKSFTKENFLLSLGLEGVPGIEFKAVRLVVYTKGTRAA